MLTEGYGLALGVWQEVSEAEFALRVCAELVLGVTEVSVSRGQCYHKTPTLTLNAFRADIIQDCPTVHFFLKPASQHEVCQKKLARMTHSIQ